MSKRSRRARNARRARMAAAWDEQAPEAMPPAVSVSQLPVDVGDEAVTMTPAPEAWESSEELDEREKRMVLAAAIVLSAIWLALAFGVLIPLLRG